MNNQTKTLVECPTCRKQVEWSDKSPYRPFCSKRCQLIDLGEWAAEEHRIADKEISEQDLWSGDDKLNFSGKNS
ncbi:DNA gyrase inhibitor YacG [Gilliamella sp. G0441]|uniref:DNA gyrase inhibitor YacG n=1 Tax=Gilliamella sp. G0441 TaxID=3384760 RepID=UPI003D34163E